MSSRVAFFDKISHNFYYSIMASTIEILKFRTTIYYMRNAFCLMIALKATGLFSQLHISVTTFTGKMFNLAFNVNLTNLSMTFQLYQIECEAFTCILWTSMTFPCKDNDRAFLM